MHHFAKQSRDFMWEGGSGGANDQAGAGEEGGGPKHALQLLAGRATQAVGRAEDAAGDAQLGADARLCAPPFTPAMDLQDTQELMRTVHDATEGVPKHLSEVCCISHKEALCSPTSEATHA